MRKQNSIFLFLFCSAILCGKTHKLVEIQKLHPNIIIDIRYATKNNFTRTQIYDSPRCFIHKTTAEKLLKVQVELEEMGLGLKIFDGYRPLSAQYKMFDAYPDETYVANPYKGNISAKHCRGCAVDCTLIELKTGKELEMPSAFDDFSEKAHLVYKQMSPKAAIHSKLLQLIMIKHGFKPYHGEWWHFNEIDWKKYPILNISLSEIR